MQYRACGLRKNYGGIVALAGVDFAVHAGSVHALVGENGAGKSTLLKILAGGLRPDEGTLELDGDVVSFRSTVDAADRGIAIVTQELTLFPDVDLIGNLFPIGAPTRLGFVDRGEVERRARGVLVDLGVDEPLGRLVGDLPLAEQQLVEIARAIITEPRVLILDEPTSALDRSDVSRVHGVLDVLRSRDVAVVYVSHILGDVLGNVDEVTVLRDGKVAMGTRPVSSLTLPEIVTAMTGEELVEEIRHAGDREPKEGEPLEVSNLSVGEVTDVSFVVRPGEVVGLAGLAGAGQHEVFDVIVGNRRHEEGTVRFPGGAGDPRRVRDAVRAGVAVVPGDRKGLGLHLEDSVWENIAHVRSLALTKPWSRLNRRDLRARAARRVDELSVVTPSVDVAVAELSGGNQQKVVFAKWAETEPRVVLMDDPTRGIDVGGRTEVWHLIERQADEGAVQVVLSSDPFELASICDRVLVFHEGRIADELIGSAISHSSILEAMNAARPPTH